jgi:hypothetical protein
LKKNKPTTPRAALAGRVENRLLNRVKPGPASRVDCAGQVHVDKYEARHPEEVFLERIANQSRCVDVRSACPGFGSSKPRTPRRRRLLTSTRETHIGPVHCKHIRQAPLQVAVVWIRYVEAGRHKRRGGNELRAHALKLFALH